MGSKDKGRANEDALKAAAEAARRERDVALTTAREADPLEARSRKFVTDVWDWRDGKNGPIDIREFPDDTAVVLNNQARKSTDAGRVGRGSATLEGGDVNRP